MNFRPFLLIALILGFLHHGRCGTNVTLVASGSLTNNFSVSTGQVAKIVTAYLQGVATLRIGLSYYQFDYNQASGSYDPNGKLPIVVPGPANITVAGNGNGKAFCTIEVSSADDSFLPSNAVVIPADSGGPVNIILESSADLVTWTAASPGTYGTSTTNRFFRVRAQRTP